MQSSFGSAAEQAGGFLVPLGGPYLVVVMGGLVSRVRGLDTPDGGDDQATGCLYEPDCKVGHKVATPIGCLDFLHTDRQSRSLVVELGECSHQRRLSPRSRDTCWVRLHLALSRRPAAPKDPHSGSSSDSRQPAFLCSLRHHDDQSLAWCHEVLASGTSSLGNWRHSTEPPIGARVRLR